MRTTADVTMIPKPATPAPTNDASSPATSTTATPDASFKKTLEGAQTKQKGAPAKVAGKAATKAVSAKAVQKLPVDAKVSEETETVTAETAAEETVAENTVAEETPLQQTAGKDQPVAKTGKQKVVAGKAAVAVKQEKPAQLALEKPREAKAKATRPATTKQNTDSSDTTETPPDNSNLAAAQVVANPQTETPPQPVEQDTQVQQKAEDVTAKAVVPGTAAKAKSSAQAQTDSDKPAAADFDEAMAAAEEISGPDDSSPAKAHGADTEAAPTAVVATAQPMAATAAAKVHLPAPTAQAAPEVQFADANHPKIVTEIHGKLLPNGGTMTIRLDPPELGALQISVHVRDGVMTAAFETSNDQATRVLSHSLGQLKSALESAGMSVEKLHVQQSSKQESSDGNSDRQQSSQEKDQQQQARQEQQRQQMLNRMWKKLAGGEDPLDLVA